MEFDFKIVTDVKEIGKTVYVFFSNGSREEYDSINLAARWLKMSNDNFYREYGFNYVPSEKTKDMARLLI